MGSLKSNSNRNFASDDDKGFLFDGRAWPDPGKSWFDLVLANIDRTKYRNIFSLICKYFPTVSGCLTGWQLAAGCCSVKSRPGAGILILYLQSPSIFPSPLCCSSVDPLRIPDPKLTKLVEICKMHGETETFLHCPHCTVDRYDFSQPRSKIHKIHKNKVKPLLMSFTWRTNIFQ